MELICKKLYLKPWMTVLDIGCGWWWLAKYMAEKYKVKVTWITLSKDQFEYATEKCKNLDIQILLEDYRDHIWKYDAIVTVWMIEHTGFKNHKDYFEMVNKSLNTNWKFLLHTIWTSDPFLISDPWVTKYVFPWTELPTVKQVTSISEDIFILEDFHNFWVHYVDTLKAWFENFDKNWDKIKWKYDEKFYRMWKYYLLACAGSFKSRDTHLFQFVFSKRDIDKWYDRI